MQKIINARSGGNKLIFITGATQDTMSLYSGFGLKEVPASENTSRDHGLLSKHLHWRDLLHQKLEVTHGRKNNGGKTPEGKDWRK